MGDRSSFCPLSRSAIAGVLRPRSLQVANVIKYACMTTNRQAVLIANALALAIWNMNAIPGAAEPVDLTLVADVICRITAESARRPSRPSINYEQPSSLEEPPMPQWIFGAGGIPSGEQFGRPTIIPHCIASYYGHCLSGPPSLFD